MSENKNKEYKTYDEKPYAEVTLNYVKKIESIEGTITSLYVGNGWTQNYPEQHIDTTVTNG